MEEAIKILEEKIEKDYKDMMSVINSTSLPLFVEDTIEDMHILIENLIARNKELEKLLDDRLWNEHIHKETDKMWRNKIKEKMKQIGDYSSIGNDYDYLYSKGQYELCKELLD